MTNKISNKNLKKLDIRVIVEDVISILPERNKSIVMMRHGIDNASNANENTPDLTGVFVSGNRTTLESIGRIYNITRERVRQIEESSYKKIANSDECIKLQPIFDVIIDTLNAKGGVSTEDYLLSHLIYKEDGPYFSLILSISNNLIKIKETDSHQLIWALSRAHSNNAIVLLEELVKYIKLEDRPMETVALYNIACKIHKSSDKLILTRDTFENIISLSKIIKKNPYSLWGLYSWSSVSPRGVRDKAVLVCEKHKRPLHFREIASLIDESPFKKSSNKNTHPQTVHNELIKNKDKFVRVGLGLYVLKKWGYKPGTVKDIIVDVLKKEGSNGLHKDDIVTKVLKQRSVKNSTVLLNLQDKGIFKKGDNNKYYLS